MSWILVLVPSKGLSRATAERYVRRARDFMIAKLGTTPSVLRSEYLELYDKIIRDTEASHADRIAASKEARRMLGLDAPAKSININANVDSQEPPIQDILQEILKDPEARLKACEFSEAIGKLRSKQPAGGDAHANARPADGN